MSDVILAALSAFCLAGCGAAPQSGVDTLQCTVVETGIRLPRDARETSGLVSSAVESNVFWTHNDRGNDPVLFAVGSDGTLRARVTVAGARLVDWEDIERAPCSSGHCLYIADIGDNSADRESITIYEIAEPAVETGIREGARALHARYPDGPRNAEALFALPDGNLYIVTKGDDAPSALYRYPASARGSDGAVLERVRDVPIPRRAHPELVTAATASEDSRWIAIRTYTSLHVVRTDDLLDGGADRLYTFDLTPLGESQGESVVLTNDGTVWLTSEAEDDGEPMLYRLSCRLPVE